MIPRIIHQIWFGGDIPDHLDALRATWTEHHPDWDYVLWTEDTLDWLTHRQLIRDAPLIVPDHAVGQFRSDVARYEILLRHGGFYCDVDTRCLRPVDDALEGQWAFAARELPRWVGNTYLACAPGREVMREIHEGLPDSVRRSRGRGSAAKLTGPQYITPIWERHGAHVAPTKEWFPYGYQEVRLNRVPSDFGDAYAEHRWEHSRRPRGTSRRRR